MRTLLPAYGRDYKNRKEVQTDLDADKDFMLSSILDGYRYINREQLAEEGATKVLVRYKNQRTVGEFKVKPTAAVQIPLLTVKEMEDAVY